MKTHKPLEPNKNFEKLKDKAEKLKERCTRFIEQCEETNINLKERQKTSRQVNE